MSKGTSVQRDFVETPSQMLENWCYEQSILERLSKHVQTGETLPDELRKQLVAAKKACALAYIVSTGVYLDTVARVSCTSVSSSLGTLI